MNCTLNCNNGLNKINYMKASLYTSLFHSIMKHHISFALVGQVVHLYVSQAYGFFHFKLVKNYVFFIHKFRS